MHNPGNEGGAATHDSAVRLNTLTPVLNQFAMSCAVAENGSPRSFSIDDGCDASNGALCIQQTQAEHHG